MYIVKLHTPTCILYFSGQYMRGLYSTTVTSTASTATILSAKQADDVGVYYERIYKWSFELIRV